MNDSIAVYGIGNVLIDILVRVSDEDIRTLGLAKGSMHLTDGEERGRPVDFIRSRNAVYRCGGSAPNTIITLAALGVPSGLSGNLGNDDFGRRYARHLVEDGVVSCLSSVEGNTGSSIILITPDAQRTMNTSLGVNRDYTVENIDPEAIERADYFFFTGYMWDTPGQKEALRAAVSVAEGSGTKIVFDAADTFAVQRAGGEFIPLIRDHVDIVLANAEEGNILTGGAGPETALSRLAGLCDIVVIKDGRKGSLIRQGKHIYRIPAYPADTVDTTGAGDIYAAGLLYGLCKKWNLETCGRFASFLAARIVEVTGARFPPEVITDIRTAAEDGTWDTAYFRKRCRKSL